MKIIPFDQGSEDWLAYRRKRIMATDCGILLGLNPWSTPYDLWRQKLQMVPPIESNERMRRGQLLEPIARDMFIKEKSINMTPMVVQSSEYFWMAASLDGISDDKTSILEIKCPGLDTHLLATNGQVKDYYYSQMQHQLLVTECQICYYFSYNPDCKNQSACLEIVRNEEYIKNMIEIEKRFYKENLCGRNEPDKTWTFKTKMKAPKQLLQAMSRSL
jgi:putative phage-type endonuclease